jgi:hypothetical protein
MLHAAKAKDIEGTGEDGALLHLSRLNVLQMQYACPLPIACCRRRRHHSDFSASIVGDTLKKALYGHSILGTCVQGAQIPFLTTMLIITVTAANKMWHMTSVTVTWHMTCATVGRRLRTKASGYGS